MGFEAGRKGLRGCLRERDSGEREARVEREVEEVEEGAMWCNDVTPPSPFPSLLPHTSSVSLRSLISPPQQC